ncbi:hypothetical protein [Streptomyces sp. NBC_01794]|nr:hypothetical protein OIE54_11890 [Streptomyces sp. NBC_01794]
MDDYAIDNSAEAWEEDWNDCPTLGGMGAELEQMGREQFPEQDA